MNQILKINKDMNSDLKHIDIHSHLNFPDYDVDREEVIERMREKRIGTITIATSLETSKSSIELSDKYENIYAAIGFHPLEIDEVGHNFLNEFEGLVKHPKVVAIGECGMDYGRSGILEEDLKIRQRSLFELQIDFAARWNKPIMIHARNSNGDILDILESRKKEYGDKLRGNAHFFTGSTEEAKRYYDLDFSTSFTGVITFTHDYDQAVMYAPIDKIMAETDAPFVSPVPYRGKRNEPSYVLEIVKKIAEIREVNVDDMANSLRQNAVAKFDLV